jgi:hypothetical protein
MTLVIIKVTPYLIQSQLYFNSKTPYISIRGIAAWDSCPLTRPVAEL